MSPTVAARPWSVADLLRPWARSQPRRVALESVPLGASITYGQLEERTNRLAHGLAGLGLVPGDRLACWLSTSPWYVELYLAAAKAGLVVVPVNDRYREAEAGHVLADAGVRALVFDATTAERVQAVDPDGVLLVDLDGQGRTVAGARPLDDLRTGSADPPSWVPEPGSPFALGYTSGTTGFPKGAVLTHGSVRAIGRTNALAYHLRVGSVSLFGGTMSFVSTVPANLLAHLFMGGTVVMLGTTDVERVIWGVETYQANFTGAPPPLVAEYAEAFAANRPRLRSLVSVLQSSGKADPVGLAALGEALDGRLVLGLGMTENSGGLVTATRPDQMHRALAGEAPQVYRSAGAPVPGALVEVRDADGRVLPADGTSVGEIVIATDSLADGYWGRQGELGGAFADGWYRTGDLGAMDGEGLVYVEDRRADLIVSGGMNVYPTEVERVIATLEGVAECAVFGVPHPRWGQGVGAAVVRRGPLDEATVIEHVRGRLASYKKPTRVWFVDALPKTVSEKVRRGALAASLLGPDGRGTPTGGEQDG